MKSINENKTVSGSKRMNLKDQKEPTHQPVSTRINSSRSSKTNAPETNRSNIRESRERRH